jgi:GT2 family glycosyltransferase
MFDERREYAAAFGSYDADPDSHALVARFRNLLHHHTHQIGKPEADTFWSGFGLVRREPYEAVGGFDPAWTGLEDIELGYRLRARGHRILLEPSLQVKHLKRWTLRSMIETDFWQRARLWTRLLLERGELPDDLNVRREQRWSVVLAAVAAASTLTALMNARSLLVTAAALAGVWWLNRGLYVLLRRVGGTAFALASLPIHVLHLLCAGLGFAWMWAEQRFVRPSAPRAPSVSV